MKNITVEEIIKHQQTGPWRELEKHALNITALAEKVAQYDMKPTLGGWTRLILAFHHRISDDIDLFINDLH